jgi:hypothetical protein
MIQSKEIKELLQMGANLLEFAALLCKQMEEKKEGRKDGWMDGDAQESVCRVYIRTQRQFSKQFKWSDFECCEVWVYA